MKKVTVRRMTDNKAPQKQILVRSFASLMSCQLGSSTCNCKQSIVCAFPLIRNGFGIMFANLQSLSFIKKILILLVITNNYDIKGFHNCQLFSYFCLSNLQLQRRTTINALITNIYVKHADAFWNRMTKFFFLSTILAIDIHHSNLKF